MDGDQLEIAAQVQWLALAFEVVEEFWLLPAFFVLGRLLGSIGALERATSVGVVALFGLLAVMVGGIWIGSPGVVASLGQSPELLETTVRYVRVEALALALATLTRFLWIPLLLIGRPWELARVLVLQAAAQLACDWAILGPSVLPKPGSVVAMAWGRALVECVVIAGTIWRLRWIGLRVALDLPDQSRSLLLDWWRRGWRSGLESLIRNLAFMFVVLRLINASGNAGTFWVANQLLWGWLLVPILSLGEALKRLVATRPELIGDALPAYCRGAVVILMGWLVSVPIWPTAISRLLHAQGGDDVLGTAYWLAFFYAFFAFNHLIDSAFYGGGRTDYMLWQTLIVNLGVFGTAFVANSLGYWSSSLKSVTILFGLGIICDTMVTTVQYWIWRRRSFSTAVSRGNRVWSDSGT
jgi:Na+-driven multidrug efflux pump